MQAEPTPQTRIDEVAGRLEKRRDTIADLLRARSGDIQAALPRGMIADQFVRVLLTALNRTPGLRLCTPASIVQAAYEAAQLGLPIDGILGYAYLVGYRRKTKTGQFVQQAQLQIGYRGYVALAYRNTDRIVSIQARVVREGDRFERHQGSDERIVHVPADQDDAPLTHCYAVAKLIHGGEVSEVLTRRQVEQRRALSQAYRTAAEDLADDKAPAWKREQASQTPWIAWEAEMWRKTALRAIVPTLPLSTEAMRALIADERRDMGLPLPAAELTESLEMADGGSE